MKNFIKRNKNLKYLSNPLYSAILQDVQRTVDQGKEDQSFQAEITRVSIKNFLNHLKENYPAYSLRTAVNHKNPQKKQGPAPQPDNENNTQGE